MTFILVFYAGFAVGIGAMCLVSMAKEDKQ